MANSLSTFDLFKHLSTEDTVTVSDEQLHRMQEALLEMLKDIIAVCEDSGLFYELGGGSALGAVRHHGFIPWDDDIDVNMKRSDLDVFVSEMKKRFADKYWVRTPQDTENYGLLMIQIRKKGTSVKTRDDYWNEECGLSIDIFPIEDTYDNTLLRNIHKLGCYYYGFAVSCRKFYRDRDWLRSISGGDREILKVFDKKIRIGKLLSWRSLDQWVRKADRWYSRCRNSNSRLVVIPSGRRHFKELYEREILCEAVKVPFADIEVNCPKGYDKYLTMLYGDYMKMPDKDHIEQHVYYKPFVI